MRVGWGRTTDDFMHSKMGRLSEKAASRTENFEMRTSGVAMKIKDGSGRRRVTSWNRDRLGERM